MCFQCNLQFFWKTCRFLKKIIRSFLAKLRRMVLYVYPSCLMFWIAKLIQWSRSRPAEDVEKGTGSGSLRSDIERLQGQIDVLEREKHEKEKHIEELTRDLANESQARKNDAWQYCQCISNLKADLKRIEADKQDALTRLSALMSVKLRDNNPNIADLSDPFRPTKLAEMFSELYDNEWTDAFTAIKGHLSEMQTITFLLDIVMDAYVFSSLELDRTWRMVSDWYLDDSLPNAQQMRKLLKDSRKVAVVKMTPGVSERYQAHLQSLCAVQTLNDMLSSKAVSSYVTQSVKLGLLMCANDPPVDIECHDRYSIVPANNTQVNMDIESKSMVQQHFQRRPFDRERFKEYTSRGSYLEYIVWPVMYLCQGGPMLGKGVAQGTREAVGNEEEEQWTWKKPE